MKINTNEIKTGMLVEFKNELWEILKTQHVKPGKGGAFNQIEMKNIKNGTKLNERFRSNETIEKATIDEQKYVFLYKESENFHFMDQKNFEQIKIKKEIIGEKDKMLSENMEVLISFYEDNPISLLLPNQISSEVSETEIALKGQTVSSSYKPAILSNGLKVQVPQFINKGDKILIDTRSLDYVKKI
tara:strand:- start:317 stop:877 length:561 start_codon:yes stop_codon:yes gene_type:complete